MNEQTVQLLTELSSKLGTTTEYLWGVLVRQARVDTIATSLQYLSVVVMGIVLWLVHKRFSKEDENGSCIYEENEVSQFAMAIAFVVFCFLCLVCFFYFGNFISSIFNPEYWALHKILSEINN